MSNYSTVNLTGLVPGQLQSAHGDIVLNEGKKTLVIQVENVGDRPIQIGSHYHFYEVNEALNFERDNCKGYRLNIPAGTATRFEPGQSRTVELVEYAGDRIIYGFQGKVMGAIESEESSQG